MDFNNLPLVRLLEKNPEITQRQLAAELDISLGKTNYCLRALIDKGWIKAQNFKNSKKKIAYVYKLTPSGIAAKASATKAFLARKQIEYQTLEREIEALRKEASSKSDVKKSNS